MFVHTTNVDLLRHGEPLGGKRVRGQRDDPLNGRGWEQMWRAARGGDWDVVVTSPLRRCAEFAMRLSAARGLPMIYEPGFKELGFGVWEGRSAAQLTVDDAQRMARFRRDPIYRQPWGAEPLHVFARRVLGAWHALLDAYPGQRVLVVTHAGVIRYLILQALGAGPGSLFQIDVPYAGRSRIEVNVRGAHRAERLLAHGLLSFD